MKMNENKLGVIVMLTLVVLGTLLGISIEKINDSITYNKLIYDNEEYPMENSLDFLFDFEDNQTKEKSYETNCAMDSEETARQMIKDGYENVEVIIGRARSLVTICYNCTSMYKIWRDSYGKILYDVRSYTLDNEIELNNSNSTYKFELANIEDDNTFTSNNYKVVYNNLKSDNYNVSLEFVWIRHAWVQYKAKNGSIYWKDWGNTISLEDSNYLLDSEIKSLNKSNKIR
jgi:hypothetical protein